MILLAGRFLVDPLAGPESRDHARHVSLERLLGFQKIEVSQNFFLV